MVVINDFPAETHSVQIIWLLEGDDKRYVVQTLKENEAVTAPSALRGATLFVNDRFTAGISRHFIERCNDQENTWTLSGAVFCDAFPTEPPKITTDVTLKTNNVREKTTLTENLYDTFALLFFGAVFAAPAYLFMSQL
jgi:hypothetical protein